MTRTWQRGDPDRCTFRKEHPDHRRVQARGIRHRNRALLRKGREPEHPPKSRGWRTW